MSRPLFLFALLVAPLLHADIDEVAALLIEQGYEEFDGRVPERKENIRKQGIEINDQLKLTLDGRYFQLHYVDSVITIGGKERSIPKYIEIRVLQTDDAEGARKAMKYSLRVFPRMPYVVENPDIGDQSYQTSGWCAFTRGSTFVMVSNRGHDTQQAQELVLNHAKLIDDLLAKQ